MTVRELRQLANKLTQWQHALTKSMGPLFSDPLRAIKRIIKQAEHGEASGTGAAVDEKEEAEKQQTEKKKRTTNDSEEQKQVGTAGKRAKMEQSTSVSDETEHKSGAG